MRIMFCNIPWRENYMGEEGALESESLCFESYNFYEIDNHYYGYCNNGEDIALDKFENIKSKEVKVKNVLVIWVSENKIIGWYKNAQVYKKCNIKNVFNARRYEMVYNIRARAKDCTLIPANNRVEFTKITRSVLLMDLENNTQIKLMKNILAYIKNYRGESLNKIIMDSSLSSVTDVICESIDDYLAQGELLYTEYKDLEALTYYNKVIELEENNAMALNGRGLVLTSLNKYTLALKSLDKALNINPLMEEAIYNKGIVYSALGDFKRGINCFKAALELNPTFDDTYVKISLLYKAMGEEVLAKEYIEKAIKLNRNNSIFKQ